MYTKEQIEAATVSYYTGVETGITDAAYDKAFAEHFPGIEPLDLFREKTKNSAGGNKVNLQYPMLSLAKVTEDEEYAKWQDKALAAGATKFEVFPKWDGLAVQVIKTNGVLVSATTRGNGTVGEDVTRMFNCIPGVDFMRDGVYGVEVIMTHANFEEVSKEHDYTSPRNAASGIIQRDSKTHWFLARYLRVQEHWKFLGAGPMEFPRFRTETFGKYNTWVHSHLAHENRDADTDGVVIVAKDDNGILKSMGEGTTTPHWAVAWKFETETRETTLLDVQWEQNRTKVTPVAVFHPPVYFGKVKVEKASLHNIDIIRNLDLAIGDKILVERSGEVIPQVAEVIDRPVGRIEIVAPEKSEVTLQHMVKHVADVFDIKGLGPAVQAQMADLLSSECPGKPTPEWVIWYMHEVVCAKQMEDNFDGFGEVSAQNLMASMSYSFEQSTPAQWLAAIGIPTLGKRKWATVIKAHGSVSEFAAARDYEDIAIEIEGVGPATHQAIAANWHSIWEVSRMLINLGKADPPQEEQEVVGGSLAGVKVVVTGKVGTSTRDGVHNVLKLSHGAEVQGSVSKNTTVLVVGGEPNTPSSKVVKAEKLGIPVVYCNNIDELEEAIKSVI